MRVIALGRKNFLFVGNDQAGENLAILQTVMATCQAHGVNPYEYLRDVLIRVNTHPMNQLPEIMPDRWEPPDGEDPPHMILPPDRHQPAASILPLRFFVFTRDDLCL